MRFLVDTHIFLFLINADIISQAIADDLTLITDDQHIKNYPNLIFF